MLKMKYQYQCPVCGYRDLPRPPQDDLICSCCGTHFGYHDYATTHAELRAKWIAGGARWFSHAKPVPEGWSPYVQLSEAQLIPSQMTAPFSDSQRPPTAGSDLNYRNFETRIVGTKAA
jgi:hypothetical protein